MSPMATKKKQIIQAFENMDADMLDVLLNDDQSYMDVSKEMFVAELRKYFYSNTNDAELKKGF